MTTTINATPDQGKDLKDSKDPKDSKNSNKNQKGVKTMNIMNIYMKHTKLCNELGKMNIKKSGKNKFIGYEYFELNDLLPYIRELLEKYELFMKITHHETKSVLQLINCEKPEETIEFESPRASLPSEKAGKHPMQEVGTTETYVRRYLILSAFNVCETEEIDISQGYEEKRQKLIIEITKIINKYKNGGGSIDDLLARLPELRNLRNLTLNELMKLREELSA